MQTSLHIYTLVAELKDLLIGAKFISTEFYKKEREAYLLFKADAGHFALGLAYHPVGYGSFLIPRSKIKVETKEKPWPFFQDTLDSTVTTISQYGIDRIFRIELKKGRDKYSVIVEAIGPNGNIWLLDKDDKILATLRNKKYDAKEPYTPPNPVDRLNPFECTSSQLKQSSGNYQDAAVNYFVKKNILGLDDIITAEILNAASLDYGVEVNQLSDADFGTLADAIIDFAHRFNDYQKGYIYNLKPYAAYPFKLKSVDLDAEKAKSLSLAVYQCVRFNKEFKAEVDQKQVVMEAVERYIKKLVRKVELIRNDLQNADNYDLYRKMAELLKINLTSIKKGMTQVEVEDVVHLFLVLNHEYAYRHLFPLPTIYNEGAPGIKREPDQRRRRP